ncbi:glycosyltransferase family 39 protein [Halosimplex pelagicum]|uniref:Glycosyltransferase family 39 protein n=1 Tax=Halosimplex pelagicum TaxID=869886 RepID=A0A7D5TJE3_9EURY|nr:glycosyltransferase family 39 protein [Halosimplex pelagicum]QLH84836.1 glycosyltransferase family 39 protein [Halosimplex pelagicum]
MALLDPFRRAKRQVGDDLRADPYLPYILLAALLLSSFWVWHRLPNFATRDERWRVVDPVEVLATVLDDPRLGSVSEGVGYWRTYGSAMYLSALALIPVLVVALATDALPAFADMGRHLDVGFWTHWLRTPGWMWTWGVLLVRLANVAMAVGCVYVVYRIGTTLRDRATGRLAAALLTVTWALLILAHEGGEDVPSLFFLLLSLYFAVRYVETGVDRLFYWGALFGGVSIAFKLSGGVSAVMLGVAHLQRARRSEAGFVRGALRPKFLATGVLIGVATIAAGYPSILFGAPTEFAGRLARAFGSKSQPHGWLVQPSWWWILRSYLHGVGLPLAVGLAGGALAALARVREDSLAADGLRMALVGVGVYLAVFSSWRYVRTHHLLPVAALLVVVLAIGLARLRDRRPAVGRAVVAVLLVTSAAYAGAGTLAYASQPRDQAVGYLQANAGADDTIETYTLDPQDAAVPHTDRVDARFGVSADTFEFRCPAFVVLNYHNSILYLAPDSWGKRAEVLSNDAVEAHVRALLNEDTYPYEIAGEYGREPRFLDGKGRAPMYQRLLRVSVRPRTMQYGDPQDMGVDQYTVVLRRTGPCQE